VITPTPDIQDLLDLLKTETFNTPLTPDTLRKATEKVRKNIATQLQEVTLRMHWPYPDQDYVASHLNSLPYSHFTKGDIDAAYEVAQVLDKAIAERNTATVDKRHHRRMVFAVYDMPKPFYTPLANKESITPRMYGSTLTFMTSSIRHALHPDWIDFDIRNCHIAIIAYLFDAPRTREFLATGASFWQELMNYMNIAPEKWEQAKEFLKVALYSIAFGKHPSDANTNLENELGCRGIWWDKQFTTHPIVQEITHVLATAKNAIKAKNGMQSAYGWLALDDGRKSTRKVDSILCCAIQSYELSIVSSCVMLVENERTSDNSDFDIVLWQHDGLSIALKKSASVDAIASRLQKAVTRRASEYGMEMVLVRDE